MTLVTRGLKFGDNKAGEPVTGTQVGRFVEAVSVDLENLQSRIEAAEKKSGITDLGTISSENEVVGVSGETPDGLVTFIDDDGERKFGIRFGGKLLIVTTY